MIELLSIANRFSRKGETEGIHVSIFEIVLLIVMFFWFILLTYHMKNIIILFDRNYLTWSDYSVKLFKIPTKGDIGGERGEYINDILGREISGRGFDVKKINLVYDVEGYEKLKM